MSKTTYAAAKQFLECGISVTAGNGKVPAFSPIPYRSRYATDTELRDWFLRYDYTLMLVCGHLSDLTVLDADSVTAETFIAEHAWTSQIAQTPSGGKHYYFRFADVRNHVNVNGIRMDVRSEGGVVVAPPSAGYRWIMKGARGTLLDVLPQPKPVKRYQAPELPDDALIDRTINYLAKLPPAIAGQGGHRICYRAACVVVDRIGHLTIEQMIHVMQEWNSRCEPEWSHKELEHKLNDALRR
ncbi:MAG: hypothetical protein CMJ47_05625 [Planctomyces sp.]|nr:hypothetical protein [Planctomyces sp.]